MNPAILEDESLGVDHVEPSLTLTSLSDILHYHTPHVGDEPTIHGERLSSIDIRDLPAFQDNDITGLDETYAWDSLVVRRARVKLV